MYGFHCFRMKKLGKPLESVWFSFLFSEKKKKTGKPLEYISLSFGNKENIHIPIVFEVFP